MNIILNSKVFSSFRKDFPPSFQLDYHHSNINKIPKSTPIINENQSFQEYASKAHDCFQQFLNSLPIRMRKEKPRNMKQEKILGKEGGERRK